MLARTSGRLQRPGQRRTGCAARGRRRELGSELDLRVSAVGAFAIIHIRTTMSCPRFAGQKILRPPQGGFSVGAEMHIAYMDDAGDLGTVTDPPQHNDQPVFALTVLLVNHTRLSALVPDFLQLKRNFFPGLIPAKQHFLAAVLPEIKGADLRRDIARGSRNQARQATRFLSEVLDLCVRSDVKLISKIFIKAIGQSNSHTAVYTAACQSLFRTFDHYLSTVDDIGFCIADSRNKGLNVPVAHSIFTQMFSTKQAAYPRIVELPTFGHSDNHVGVQICDLLASALFVPIATHTYCTGHIANVHVQSGYSKIRAQFTNRLKPLLYRYQDAQQIWRGGITVSDGIGHRPSSLMFKNVPAA